MNVESRGAATAALLIRVCYPIKGLYQFLWGVLMASTYTNLAYHVVFSTKYRKPTIAPDVRDDLYKYLGGIIRAENGLLIQIGGMPDHVHLLVSIPPKVALSDFLRIIKANSSKWLNERPDHKQTFKWQTGYAAFSVSVSQRDVVERYIQNQEQHHRRQSFQEELIDLLNKHQIQYDPRYVFETENEE